MLKCLICGAVIPDGSTVCPVCGVGPENFVPVEQEQTGFKRDTSEMFMILGGGAAAVSAACAIRERNSECGICILTSENCLPYNRPMLTKQMNGITPEKILIHDKQWYDQNDICVLTGKQVKAIQPDKHQILVNEDEIYYYDKCVYALGAYCFVPPLEGVGLDGVFTLRSVDDAQKLSEYVMGKSFNAVVIGGGVLGLEAAWSLRKLGAEKVTVLETAPRLMPRQLDKDSSQKLAEICAKAGVEVVTSAQTERICGESKVNGVRLKDGKEILADVVVVSCGVRANTQVAVQCGVEIGRAVKVDAHCRTNIPDIFACGDCAEFNGTNYALWSQAEDMGRVAGACAAGDNIKFAFSNYPVSFNGMNTSLFAVGDCASRDDIDYRVENTGEGQKRFYASGKLCGAVLIGDTSAASQIRLEI